MNLGLHKSEPLVEIVQHSLYGRSKITALWRAVILQAIIDASSNYQRTENRLEKDKARSWLLNTDADFKLVCSMADYHPDYVREKAKSVITKRNHLNKVMRESASATRLRNRLDEKRGIYCISSERKELIMS